MIRIKMYGTWDTFKTKADAINKLMEWVACSGGAEQNRYAYALSRVWFGGQIVDTDSEDY